MRARRHTAAAPILSLLLAVAASRPVSAAGSSLWSAGPTTLRSSADGYTVATTRGERPLALPAGVEVEELFALRQGAFLSARAPVSPAGDRRRDLYLGLVDDSGWHALPSPEMDDEAAKVRENAVPLASTAGDLEAVAWLEGADRQSYAVRFSTWDGLRWSPPETVAPAAAGSQMALGAATLADGTKLLVWSRFDGHDDEIVASRWSDGAWSPARPLAADNAVPDITPSVVAVAGGALAAWSRYDGHDYRVVLSRFDGREWSAPAWAGPAGSTYPALQRSARTDRAPAGEAAVWMTYASARDRGWTIVELDSRGRSLRRGRVADAPSARPALAPQPGGELRLRWADSESDVDLQ
jgi:hypothetical protein